jgi:hypothetical protein
MAGFTLTGNPIYDLLVVGAVGGLMVGMLLFGGILQLLYWSFIGRMYPIIGWIKRQERQGDAKTPPIRDYGQRRKNKKTGKFYIHFFKTKADTVPLEFSDITQDNEKRQWFFGLQTGPQTIVPVEDTIGYFALEKNPDGSVKTDASGSPSLIIKAIAATQPIWRAESDLSIRERLTDLIDHDRFKKKIPNWWSNPVLAQYIGAAVLLFVMFIGFSIAAPKIGETVNGIFSGQVDSVGGKCVRAGVEAGVSSFMALQTGKLDLKTINATMSANAPADATAAAAAPQKNMLFGLIPIG